MPKITKLAPRALCALAIAAVAALVAVPAFADPAKPTPCDGKYVVNDPAGDQGFSEEGQQVFATPENTDVLGYFYTVDGDKVMANIVVSNLDTAPMFYATRYRAYQTVGGVVHYVQALVDSSGATYSYGEELVLPGAGSTSYTNDGDTTGTLFEGANGIIQIVLPPDFGGKVGTALGATSATAGELAAPVPEEAMLPPFYFQGDTAPDASADGPTVHPQPCAAVEAGGPAAGGQLGTTTPTIAVKAAAVSAKKASKKKSVSFTLSSSEALTSVTAKLKKGSKIVASGKLASLSDSGTIKLKLKQKKLKKGSYTLAVAAKRSSGESFSATLKVKVKA
jgi:hypothetical protein